jgi:hypothetical protein
MKTTVFRQVSGEFLKPGHMCNRWPLMAIGDDFPLRRIVPRKQRLDRTVSPIPNPTIDLKPLCLPNDPIAKPNTLNAAFDADADSHDAPLSSERENWLIDH